MQAVFSWWLVEGIKQDMDLIRLTCPNRVMWLKIAGEFMREIANFEIKIRASTEVFPKWEGIVEAQWSLRRTS